MKKKNLPAHLILLCAWAACLLCSATRLAAQPPSSKPRLSPVLDANINGFWEYLPRNYSIDLTQTYPLLVFMHGYGESGSTPDSITLRQLLNNGTPKIIGNGLFPDSFYVGGKWFKFIVIAPQIKDGFLDLSSTVAPSTIDAVIEYAKGAYRVDPNRIYLAGLSMGGGVTWDYAGSSAAAARKLAAVAIACGAADLDATKARNIAGAELPVLATHNLGDDLILASRTKANIQAIEAFDPNPAPRAYYWDSTSGGSIKHNVWTRTFENLASGSTVGGNLRDSLGMNVYEWLLQYERGQTSLPVVWQSFTADIRNTTVVLRWEVSSEHNLKAYEAEKSHDGQTWKKFASAAPSAGSDPVQVYSVTDAEAMQAVTYYRIKQIDLDGKSTYSTVEKLIRPAASATVRIFPSPFTGSLTVSFLSAVPQVVTAQLINSAGSVVALQRIIPVAGSQRLAINGLQGLPAGMYWIKLTDQKGTVLATEKVFK